MKAIKRTRIADLLKSREYGVEVNVRGWVRTRRSSKQVAFVALNDGSTINNVQVVIDADKFDEELVKQFIKKFIVISVVFFSLKCRKEGFHAGIIIGTAFFRE